MQQPAVYLIDFLAGNIRSLANAIEKVGYRVEWIKSPEDVAKANVSAEFTNTEVINKGSSLLIYYFSSEIDFARRGEFWSLYEPVLCCRLFFCHSEVY